MTFKQLGVVGMLFLAFAVATRASEFDGTWRGAYNGQPITLMPDGSFPETVTQFELRLHAKNHGFAGTFRRLQGGDSFQPLKNAKRFGDHICFDVTLDSEDMRWCVRARNNQLRGTWSAGPEGGPLLSGAGVGARLFKIEASKEK
jgi:hypothetical protein